MVSVTETKAVEQMEMLLHNIQRINSAIKKVVGQFCIFVLYTVRSDGLKWLFTLFLIGIIFS